MKSLFYRSKFKTRSTAMFLTLMLIFTVIIGLFNPTITASANERSSMVIGRVNANSVNVRSSASLSSSILGQVNINERFRITDESGNFYKIQYAASQEAYIYKNYLDKSTVYSTGTVTLNSNAPTTIVYNGPGTSSFANLGSISSHTQAYTAYGTFGSYYIIMFHNMVGYVPTSNFS